MTYKTLKKVILSGKIERSESKSPLRERGFRGEVTYTDFISCTTSGKDIIYKTLKKVILSGI